MGPLSTSGRPAGSTWFRAALVHTLSGLTLGLLASLTIVWLGHTVFPSISEYGVDAGLRLKVHVDRLRNFAAGMPALDPNSAQQGDAARSAFVFLDVDPEYGPGAVRGESGCAALPKGVNESAPVGGGDASGCPAGVPATLNCSASRPLNRYLLADIVKGLRDRGARLIVLDVVLADEPGVVDRCEAKALSDEFDNESATPVIYAAPIQLSWQDSDSFSRNIVRVEDDVASSVWARGPAVMGAVAFPEADHVIRRYPTCFRIQGEREARSGLPQLAAEIALSRTGSLPSGTCDTSEVNEAPRIVFTLPHMAGHQDDPSTDRESWAYYHGVYNRCLAAKFWDTDGSQCSQRGMYENKIVVVGTSNPIRRDWHYTPLGNLVGAEVVINAIRSRLQFPNVPEPSFGQVLAHEWWIVLWCSLVWFLFHAWRCATSSGDNGPSSPARRRIARGVRVTLAFVGALFAVLALTLYLSLPTPRSLPSLDIVVGVLAITLEQYTEALQWVVHRVKHSVAKLLGAHAL